MKIVKKTNGNIVILNTDGTVKQVIQQTGVQLLLEGNEIKLIQNGYPIGYIAASDVTHTQIEPAAQVAFSGDNSALMTLLAEDFFVLSSVDESITKKEYVALITQSGTNAPVATVLKNTLGGTAVWSYVGVGNYNLTLVGAFTVGKTICNGKGDFSGTSQVVELLTTGTDETGRVLIYPISTDVIEFFSNDILDVATNLGDLMGTSTFAVKIEVYS